MADSNYKRGEMEVGAQEGTFTGFMDYSKYGGVAIVLILLIPILMFGANVSWFASLVVSVILGVILGVALKFNARYFALLILCAGAFFVIMGLADLFLF